MLNAYKVQYSGDTKVKYIVGINLFLIKIKSRKQLRKVVIFGGKDEDVIVERHRGSKELIMSQME